MSDAERGSGRGGVRPRMNHVCFCSPSPALEGKVRSGEKKAEVLVKEKLRVEAELESVTKKSHDASGQLVHISQELLKKERYEVAARNPRENTPRRQSVNGRACGRRIDLIGPVVSVSRDV